MRNGRLIEGAQEDGRVLATLRGDRIVAGKNGKELAAVDGHRLVRDGVTVALTDGRHVILGGDGQGAHVGDQYPEDTLAGVMAASYFVFFSNEKYPERHMTFVSPSDLSPLGKTMSMAVEGNKLYPDIGIETKPSMNWMNDTILEGEDASGKVLGTVVGNRVSSADGRFYATFTDRRIDGEVVGGRKATFHIFGDNPLAGPLGAMGYYVHKYDPSGGSGGDGSSYDVLSGTTGARIASIRDDKLYAGGVVARVVGDRIYRGEFGNSVIATISGRYLYEGDSKYGDPVAYLWSNAAYRGSSTMGTVICRVNGGGNRALALAAAYCLYLRS